MSKFQKENSSPKLQNFKFNKKYNVELQNIFLGTSEQSELQMKILVQNKIMKTYSSCVNILLNIISTKNMEDFHLDLCSPIQKLLEKIENVSIENCKMKKENIDEINKGSLLNQNLNNIINEKNMILKEYLNTNTENQENEREKLLESLQFIANELDEQTEKSKNYQTYIYENYGNFSSFEKNIITLNSLKKKNIYLKQTIEVYQHQKNSSNWANDISKMINCKNYGNYTLEQKEYYNKINGFISC